MLVCRVVSGRALSSTTTASIKLLLLRNTVMIEKTLTRCQFNHLVSEGVRESWWFQRQLMTQVGRSV